MLLTQSSATDKFYDVVSLVDRCKRQGRIDASDVTLLVGLLRALIAAQSAALEKSHAASMPVLKEASGDAAQPLSAKRKLSSAVEQAVDVVGQQQVKEGLRFLRTLDEQDVFLERVRT